MVSPLQLSGPVQDVYIPATLKFLLFDNNACEVRNHVIPIRVGHLNGQLVIYGIACRCT